MMTLLLSATAGALVTPPARSLHVAAWQGAAVTADVPANVARVATEVAAAGREGVEVLLFPEMFLHGYDATEEQLRELALTQDSPELKQVAEAAAGAGVCVGVPYAERDGEALFNSMAVFDATGELVCNYRKVNLWGDWEQGLFQRGAPGSFEPFELATASGEAVTCGCLICYDIEFPEPSRALALQGAELLLVPTALGEGDVEMATPLNVVPTRALENHVHIIYSNLEGGADAAERPGQSGVPSFCGRSAIFDPAGATAARAAELTGGTRSRSSMRILAFQLALETGRFLRSSPRRHAPLGDARPGRLRRRGRAQPVPDRLRSALRRRPLRRAAASSHGRSVARHRRAAAPARTACRLVAARARLRLRFRLRLRRWRRRQRRRWRQRWRWRRRWRWTSSRRPSRQPRRCGRGRGRQARRRVARRGAARAGVPPRAAEADAAELRRERGAACGAVHAG